MSDLTQEERDRLSKKIEALCSEAGCNEKLRKIHRDQIMRRWNPHPPQNFKDWWKTHFDSNWIDVKRAYNCERYRQEFLGAKEVGVA